QLGECRHERTHEGAHDHGCNERPPAVAAENAGELEPCERADREEGAVREVEHVHEPVDEGQARCDEEVERSQAEAGDEQEYDGAHRAASGSVCGVVSSDAACTPRSLVVSSSSSRSAAVPT